MRFDRDIAEMAAELGKSPGAVYAARSRVMRRLRDEIEVHGDEHAGDPEEE